MPKDPLIGKTISHFKIVDYLGGGGMGVVYKAEDTNLKRTVALKFLPVELTRTSDAKARFRKEAQAASALDHPRIGTIYEINETEDGHMYIAMAYYEGETLKQKMSARPMSVDKAIELVLQIANGLATAHEKGIIHRDIKPANIIITTEGFVKIVDFGLAKLDDSTRLTKSGTAMGTPAYMSPEQAKGKQVDHKSDIWALGVIFYELLTGKLPFWGDNDMSMLYNIVNEPPQPVSKLNSKIPAQVEKVIDKVLSKDPQIRYDSVDEFIRDVKALHPQPSSEAQTVVLKQEPALASQEKPDVDQVKTMVIPEKVPVADRPAASKSKKPFLVLATLSILAIVGFLNVSKIKSFFTPDVDAGYIRIDSEPPGAAILVDGIQTGKTTPAILGPFNAGQYRISLTTAGFEDWSKQVGITAKDTLLKIASLTPIKQSVNIESTASVQKEKTQKEETPTVLTPPETKPVPKKTVGKTRVSKPVYGNLFVDSTPQGARIFLNGNSTGHRTPHRFTRLKPAEYKVRLAL
ncbi:MAG: protein kinase, partial [bacterium]